MRLPLCRQALQLLILAQLKVDQGADPEMARSRQQLGAGPHQPLAERGVEKYDIPGFVSLLQVALGAAERVGGLFVCKKERSQITREAGWRTLARTRM